MLTATLTRYALIASLIANGLFVVAVLKVDAQRDTARAELSALQADVATQRAAFEAAARLQEREQRQALAGIRVIFDKEMTNASTMHDAVVAGLRADALRLRSHWQGCVATTELSAAVAAGSRTSDAAELRAQGAADLVRLGAECDTRIHGLQATVRTYSGSTP